MNIPKVIEQYFDACNSRSFDQFSELFVEQAEVTDEHSRNVGADEIRAWILAAVEEYQQTIEVQECVESDGGYLCHCLVSGTFDGSPAMIDHHFFLDEGRIQRLVIT